MSNTPSKGFNPHVSVAGRMIQALRRLRDLHPDMTLLQCMFFLQVAANPGASQRSVYTALDTNDSNGSRTLAILSDIGGRASPPLDLVTMTVNPMDRRERLLDLSPKGRRLMDDITRDLGLADRR
jgi:DNA-binding MarR family transcriptional regulator